MTLCDHESKSPADWGVGQKLLPERVAGKFKKAAHSVGGLLVLPGRPLVQTENTWLRGVDLNTRRRVDPVQGSVPICSWGQFCKVVISARVEHIDSTLMPLAIGRLHRLWCSRRYDPAFVDVAAKEDISATKAGNRGRADDY